ncbi:glycoside hydrolase family 108 protein [Chitinolyticbacter meiyuanensis]|uniref:glycoside hydrolase family 108 protein n=1 Tax=Chitinolyticbacter meiyuanensis TaxID=682798 RepID=UPI0011E5AC5E|nr:glycosyl hydrolase 108 family protein [Chitinolyticbacter meiyuanensis]
MNFDQAFAKLLGHEGGFSDHADDPGGATRYGVTEAVARANGYRGDMRFFPLDQAKTIYRSQYWDAVKADQLPDLIRYAVFDGAVNSGPHQSIKWLQRALGVADDGKLGPISLSAVSKADQPVLLSRLLAARLRFMTGLTNWPSFSRGWARRIADLMEG